MLMTGNYERERPVVDSQRHHTEQIVEAHRTLREQLDVIATMTTPASLLTGLLGLPEVLVEHFATEEQSGGLYDDLRARCPTMSTKLDSLIEEHTTILETLDDLCRRLKVSIESEREVDEITNSMKNGISRLLEQLRRHEHDESCMIGDVYYSDESGGG
jgi:hypothetical protein